MSALVMLSGGLDSTVALFWAKERYGSVCAVTFEYGQRHWVEIERAKALAKYCDAHKTVQLGAQGVGFGSLLTRKAGEIVTDSDAVVPARNVLFWWAAAVHAAAIGADVIVAGCVADDAASFLDCRIECVAAVERAMALALGRSAAFVVPWIDRTKLQVIEEAERLGCLSEARAAWSCYAPVFDGPTLRTRRPCGKCPACVKVAAAWEAFDASHD